VTEQEIKTKIKQRYDELTPINRAAAFNACGTFRKEKLDALRAASQGNSEEAYIELKVLTGLTQELVSSIIASHFATLMQGAPMPMETIAEFLAECLKDIIENSKHRANGTFNSEDVTIRRFKNGVEVPFDFRDLLQSKTSSP
jgi:hypothetical protein